MNQRTLNTTKGCLAVILCLALVLSALAGSATGSVWADGVEGQPQKARQCRIDLEPSELVPFPAALDPELELGYDDGTAETGRGWAYGSHGFAVRFTPPVYPVIIHTVRVCLWPNWPDGDHEQFGVAVFDDNGTSGSPGSQLGAKVLTTATDWGWWDVDTAAQTITITDGDFYILYEQLGDSPDCEGLSGDTSSPDAGRSWAYFGPGSWGTQPNMNYMIRCVVDVSSAERYVGTETPGNGSTGANKLILCQFEATETGTMNQISVYSRASGSVKVGIYSDDAGAPGTLLSSNNTATAVTASQWNFIYISPIWVFSGTDYWLAAVGNATGAISYDKTPGSGTSKGKSVTFSSFVFPKTIGTSGWTSYTYERAFSGWSADNPPTSDMLIGTGTAGNGSTGPNKLILCRFLAAQTGTVNAISIYSRASGSVKVGIYADDAGAPGKLLNANSAQTGVIASQWNNIYISPTPVTAGTWYWLAAVGNANGAISYIKVGGCGTSKGKGVTFSSFVFPKSAGTSGWTSYTYVRAFAGWGTGP